MPPSDFNFIFPLLKAIIFQEKKISELKTNKWTEICILAADMMICHAGLDGSVSELPRTGMLKCIIEIISKFPRLRASGSDAISALVISEVNCAEEADQKGAIDDESLIALTSILLNGLFSPVNAVREACISSLSYIPNVSSSLDHTRDLRIWILQSDIDEIAIEAGRLWQEIYRDEPIKKEYIMDMINLTGTIFKKN